MGSVLRAREGVLRRAVGVEGAGRCAEIDRDFCVSTGVLAGSLTGRAEGGVEGVVGLSDSVDTDSMGAAVDVTVARFSVAFSLSFFISSSNT